MKKGNKIIVDTLALTLILITATLPAVTPVNLDFQAGTEEQVILVHEPVVQKPDLSIHLLTPTPVRYLGHDIFSSQGTNIQVTSFDENEGHPSVSVDADGNPILVYDQESSDFNSRVILQRSFDKGLIWPENHLLFVAGNQKFCAMCPEIDTIAGGTRALITFLGDRDPNVYFFDIVNIDDPISMIIGGFNLSDRTQYIFETSIAGCRETGGILGVIIDYKKGGYDLEKTLYILYTPDIRLTTWEGIFFASDKIKSHPCVTSGGNYLYGICQVDDSNGSYILVAYIPADDLVSENWNIEVIQKSHSNLTNPQIAVSGDNVYIVVESDTSGDRDIVCYTKTGGLWRSFTVANSPDDEMYPSVTADGKTAMCTFFKNGNLYLSKTGTDVNTWGDPARINDIDGTVMGRYRSADIYGPYGPYILWTDNRNGNNDIYFDIGTAPLVGIPAVSGGFGVTATIENTGTADATDVDWSINVDAPLLLIGGEANGTIPILPAGNSETVKSGFLLGIGKATITITADNAGATKSGFILGPLVRGVS